MLGAKVPIMLASRADDEPSRLFSCVVAVLYDAWRVNGRGAVPAPPSPKAEA
jgi:phosphate butyryltransferase